MYVATGLLGCEVSKDGELWACYLEKALAAHCGGWDKINGGQCTHAWALLTGCREQYTIRKGYVTAAVQVRRPWERVLLLRSHVRSLVCWQRERQVPMLRHVQPQ